MNIYYTLQFFLIYFIFWLEESSKYSNLGLMTSFNILEYEQRREREAKLITLEKKYENKYPININKKLLSMRAK